MLEVPLGRDRDILLYKDNNNQPTTTTTAARRGITEDRSVRCLPSIATEKRWNIRLQGALKIMETQLAETPYLAGDALTIADIACVGYLFYPEPFGFDRADFPHIDAWMTRIEGTKGWKHPYDLMPGSPADRA